jgi:hypothetical protein
MEFFIVIIIYPLNVGYLQLYTAIYSYIPDTNHVCMVYSVAVVLYLQSVLHVMLFRP